MPTNQGYDAAVATVRTTGDASEPVQANLDMFYPGQAISKSRERSGSVLEIVSW